MNNYFENELKKGAYILSLYEMAEKNDDEETKELARRKHSEQLKELESNGADCLAMYRMYESAAERGNKLVDFSECIWESRIPELVAMMRKYEVEQFTISSGYSSINNTLWTFMQNGCELKGMTLVKSATRVFIPNDDGNCYDYSDVPAFLMEIKKVEEEG